MSEGITNTLLNSYGLVTEQKKGNYKYFVDLGDRMEVAESRTVYSYQVSTRGTRKQRL